MWSAGRRDIQDCWIGSIESWNFEMKSFNVSVTVTLQVGCVVEMNHMR